MEDLAFLHIFINEGIYYIEEEYTEGNSNQQATGSPVKEASNFIKIQDQGWLLGEKKETVILTNQQKPSAAQMKFLNNVLLAVKLSLEEVEVHHINVEKPTFEQSNALKKVISFGVQDALTELGSGLGLYEVFRNQERKLQILQANTLAEIEVDKNQKKQLWLALKDMFGM